MRRRRLSAGLGRRIAPDWLWLALGLALWLALATGPALGQGEPATTTVEPATTDLAGQLAAAKSRNAELETAVRLLSQKLDQAQAPEGANGPLAAKYQEVALARYQHYIDLLAHRNAVFRWQLVASYVVLGIVALVTLAGLVFSASQLYTALRLSQPQPNIDLEVSASKVRITSSVVGVVVLTLSIVFLFLFLDRIYDIREIGGPPAVQEGSSAE